MEKTYTIYRHISPSGKSYIGQTSKKPYYERWGNHPSRSYRTSTFFYNAIKKYGWKSFRTEILFENLTQQQADVKEYEMIQKYNSLAPNGYNLREGGKQSHTNKASIDKLKEWYQISENKKYHSIMTSKGTKNAFEKMKKRMSKDEWNKRKGRVISDKERQERGKSISLAYKNMSSEKRAQHSLNISRTKRMKSKPIYDSDLHKIYADQFDLMSQLSVSRRYFTHRIYNNNRFFYIEEIK